MNVLHGSVVTQLKCGWIFNNCFIANCPVNVQVKTFWKLVDFWRRYGPWQSGTFLGDTVWSQLLSNANSRRWEQACKL